MSSDKRTRVGNFSPQDASRFCELVREGLANFDRFRGVTDRDEEELDAILDNVFHFLVGSRPNPEQLKSMYGVDTNGNPLGVFPIHGLGYFWENVMEGLRFEGNLWSNGGWGTGGAVRFANSDSSNFYHHREVALDMFRKQLKYMETSKNAAKAAPAATPSLHRLSMQGHNHHQGHNKQQGNHRHRGRAFIYVVASHGRGPNAKGEPMLLLLHHRDGGHYGVPGGMQNRGETLKDTACREFVEELLGLDGRTSSEKNTAASAMLNLGAGGPSDGTVLPLDASRDGTMASFLLVVQYTEQFEGRAAAFNQRIVNGATDEQKRNVPGGISHEMNGYAWFKLSDIKGEIKNPRKQINGRGGLFVPDRSGTSLPTRAYTITRPIGNGGVEVTRSMHRILERFLPQ